ncbi:LytR/AlgR family response regulator transcription factor [Anaerovibrio sp.]|uniref:LytR/AlgR family response regulator transcription factor n=1 Tax=Anaerovibrio sp. TaxID=1872532 RepID=UPI003F182178
MRILLYDDERAELEKLKAVVAEAVQARGMQAELVAVADEEELWLQLRRREPDVVFLDIYLEQGKLGTELAMRLKRERHDFKLVFVSFSNSFAAESYRADADYYLLKPVSGEAVEKVFSRLRLFEGSRLMTVDTGRRYLTLNTEKLVAVEVQNKSCYIHTAGGMMKEFCPLHVFEELLRQDCFLKVNRSTIINMNYVDKIEGDAFVMKGGLRVSMKSRDSKAIRDTYFEWMFNNI